MNNLSESCANELSLMVKQQKSLEYFSLSENVFDKSVFQIFEALKERNTVTELQFFMNQLSEDSWRYILKQLNWKKLSKLVLNVGLPVEVINAVKSYPVRLFFKNKNLFVEAS